MLGIPVSPPPELIVALDVPSGDEMPAVLDRIGDAVRFYKVGLELYCAEGPAALEPIAERGANIFLDLKLHDIPRTVERAVRAMARRRIALATVHAAGGRAMLEAAAQAAREAGPQAPALLAVTVLTSLGVEDLAEIGVQRTPEDQVLALAELAFSSGIDGVVCSPREAAAIRARFGPGPLLVTPGIRPAGEAPGDQKRVATPAEAVQAGATHLVVGRPILAAPDPRAAAQRIRAEMAAAG